VTPPADINEPANIKKGIAKKENESIAVNIRCGITINGICINLYNTTADDIPNATAIGAPTNNKNTKLPNVNNKNNFYHLTNKNKWCNILEEI